MSRVDSGCCDFVNFVANNVPVDLAIIHGIGAMSLTFGFGLDSDNEQMLAGLAWLNFIGTIVHANISFDKMDEVSVVSSAKKLFSTFGSLALTASTLTAGLAVAHDPDDTFIPLVTLAVTSGFLLTEWALLCLCGKELCCREELEQDPAVIMA